MGARRETSADVQWLTERKDILNKIKGQVRLYLGEEPSDIALYAQAYKADIGRSWDVSLMDTLVQAIQESQVVYGGDFHLFSQAQRTHLRILRSVSGKRKLTLALECFFAEKQDVLDNYMDGLISESRFLELVEWESLWGFPWKHYKPLVEFAKKEKIKLIGLNKKTQERSGETLGERDEFASGVLVESMKSHPDSLHYVIFGDLHIAENHLPRCVGKAFGDPLKLKSVSVYLNSESIYFDLIEKGQDGDVEVVKFQDNQFCILSSPPWVKWQSYLMYLEENFDSVLEDDDSDDWDQRVDHTDHVSSLVKMICVGLNVEMKTHDIEVYSLKDPQVLKMAKIHFSDEHYLLAHDLVQRDMSFFAPQKGFFYLSKSTVNHAAALAGKFIHGKYSRRDRVLWDFPQDFLSLIWVETMSFLLSKFVNPKRKAQTMNDLKKQLEAFDLEDKGREPLLLALDQKMSELLQVYKNDTRNKKYSPTRKSSYVVAARFLGEMLGERYFLLYRGGLVSTEEILFLLRQEVENKGFHEFYFEQLKLLDKLELEA